MPTPDERLIEVLERIERRLAALEAAARPPASHAIEKPASRVPTDPATGGPSAAPVPKPTPEQVTDGAGSEPAEPAEPTEPVAPVKVEADTSEAMTPPDPSTKRPIDETPQAVPSMADVLSHLRERKEQAHAADPAPESPEPSHATTYSVPPKATNRPAPQPVRAPKKPRDPISIERLIGGKSFMVLGVLIVVVGAGFFLKLAYDEGWHKFFSPAWRCIAAAMFGALLMGAGEAARAKLGKFAAVGFTAAGLGVLYATAFATYGVFDLVSIGTAFWLLVGVCALGLFTGVRAGSQLLTALALIGGYSVPLIFANADTPLWTLPAYLIGLLIVGSGVSVLRTGHRALASIAWWGSGLLGTLWLIGSGDDAPFIAMAFIALAWGVSHATQVFYTTRRHLNTLWRETPIFASTGTTLWAAGGLLYATQYASGVESWVVMLLLACATGALGTVLGRGLSFLRSVPTSVRERLAVTLLAQTAAMVPVVVFLAFDAPWAQAGVWFAIGAAACVVSARTRTIAALPYGLVLLAIGTFRALMLAVNGHPILDAQPGLGGLVYTPWMALVAAGGVAWLLGAWCAHRLEVATKLPALRDARLGLALVGASHFIVMLAHERAGVAPYTIGLTVLGALALLASLRKSLRPEALYCSAIYATLAIPVWFGAYVANEWSLEGAPLIFNQALLWSAALAALWLLLTRELRSLQNEFGQHAAKVGWTIAGALLLISTSVEATRVADALLVDRTAQAAALSLWWAIFGVALIVAGVLRRVPVGRYAGIGLLLAATVKVVTYDLVGLSPMLRVASFIVVGLLLLSVATGYLRATKRRESEPEYADQETEERGED